MPGISSEDFFADALGATRRGESSSAFFARALDDGLTGDPNIDPNNLERAIGEFIEDKPTLQSILGAVGQPGSAVSNVLRGEFGSAARNVGQFGADVG